MKLKNIATIKTGLVLSRKKAARYDKQKAYQQITLKSFSSSTRIKLNSLNEFVAHSEIKPEYLTQTGDILVKLRAPNIAICVGKNTQGLVISSLMCVIRLNDKNINNRFLAHYLNSKQSQKVFNIAIKGTAIPMIKTNDVADLDIFLPPISAQNKAIKTMSLLYKEQALLTELIQKKRIFTQNILDTMMANPPVNKQFQGAK